MAADWSIEIDGDEYHPIPESWIDARTAHDHDEDAPPEAVRLYAVSAALLGTRSFRVRYLHPKGTKVLVLETPAEERSDGDGYYPHGLKTGSGWPRTYVPGQYRDPDDVARLEETRHLRTLWGSRVDDVPTDEQLERALTDGGRPEGGWLGLD